jgi:chemotaxis protein CheD
VSVNQGVGHNLERPGSVNSMAGVRMGELQVSSNPGDEISAIGLGSCIGLALIERLAGVAGLAHIVLPESRGVSRPAAKFANLAVPELIDCMLRAGAAKTRIEAALVGGARMFTLGPGLDIGVRNEHAVRAALAHQAVPVRAAATGGSCGRTVRIKVGLGAVTVQEAGGEYFQLVTA